MAFPCKYEQHEDCPRCGYSVEIGDMVYIRPTDGKIAHNVCPNPLLEEGKQGRFCPKCHMQMGVAQLVCSNCD